MILIDNQADNQARKKNSNENLVVALCLFYNVLQIKMSQKRGYTQPWLPCII